MTNDHSVVDSPAVHRHLGHPVIAHACTYCLYFSKSKGVNPVSAPAKGEANALLATPFRPVISQAPDLKACSDDIEDNEGDVKLRPASPALYAGNKAAAAVADDSGGNTGADEDAKEVVNVLGSVFTVGDEGTDCDDEVFVDDVPMMFSMVNPFFNLLGAADGDVFDEDKGLAVVTGGDDADGDGEDSGEAGGEAGMDALPPAGLSRASLFSRCRI